MFTPKKTIPALAAGAALAMTSCGEDAETTVSALQVALSAFCLKAVDCIPGQTVNYCVSIFVRDYVPPACVSPLASYFECGASVDCPSFQVTPIPQCERLQMIANDCLQ